MPARPTLPRRGVVTDDKSVVNWGDGIRGRFPAIP